MKGWRDSQKTEVLGMRGGGGEGQSLAKDPAEITTCQHPTRPLTWPEPPPGDTPLSASPCSVGGG